MTGDRYLVDTNILVYAYDRSEPTKQIRSRQVLNWLVTSGSGTLSTQVLAEFFSAVTRRLPEKMSPREGYAHLQEYVRSWRVVGLTPEIVLESARGAITHHFPFYDAQIWATAKLSGIPTVLTEDFSHASRIESVEFLNPFLAPLSGEET